MRMVEKARERLIKSDTVHRACDPPKDFPSQPILDRGQAHPWRGPRPKGGRCKFIISYTTGEEDIENIRPWDVLARAEVRDRKRHPNL